MSCSLRTSSILSLLVAVVACREPVAPPITNLAGLGETCRVGDRPIKECQPPLRCRVPPDSELGAATAASVGQLCGGLADLRCGGGLACDMAPDQQKLAYGMGTCEVASRCVR